MTTLTISGAGAHATVEDSDRIPAMQGSAKGYHTPSALRTYIGARDRPTTAQTYYVRKDGSDSNDGLSDDASGAFLTIQKAVDVVMQTDYSLVTDTHHPATIYVRAGTYDEPVALGNLTGFNEVFFYDTPGNVTYAKARLIGDIATPTNVVIQPSTMPQEYAAICLSGGNAFWYAAGFHLNQTVNNLIGVLAIGSGYLELGSMHFTGAATGNSGVSSVDNTIVRVSFDADLVFNGSLSSIFQGQQKGYIDAQGDTITFNTVTVSDAVAYAANDSFIAYYFNTQTGTPTGKRFNSTSRSTITTFGSGETFINGSAAGTVSQNATYDGRHGHITQNVDSANTSAFASTGYSLTGSSAVSLVDLAGTWNTTGTPTALKINITDTASNSASKLLDLQVGGTSKFNVKKNGTAVFGPTRFVAQNIWETIDGMTFAYNSGTDRLVFGVGTQHVAYFGTPHGGSMVLKSGGAVGFSDQSSNLSNALIDAGFFRDAADVIAMRRTTNPQAFRLYETYTDSSNYERASLSCSSDTVTLAAETAGTGADNMDVALVPAGTGNVKFGTHSAVGAETVTGYITIKDAAGNSRKLAVVS